MAERFIELVAIQHYRELDPIEEKEFVESYRELVRRYKPTIEKERRSQMKMIRKTIQIKNVEEFQKLIKSAITLSDQLNKTLQQIQNFKPEIKIE